MGYSITMNGSNIIYSTSPLTNEHLNYFQACTISTSATIIFRIHVRFPTYKYMKAKFHETQLLGQWIMYSLKF